MLQGSDWGKISGLAEMINDSNTENTISDDEEAHKGEQQLVSNEWQEVKIGKQHNSITDHGIIPAATPTTLHDEEEETTRCWSILGLLEQSAAEENNFTQIKMCRNVKQMVENILENILSLDHQITTMENTARRIEQKAETAIARRRMQEHIDGVIGLMKVRTNAMAANKWKMAQVFGSGKTKKPKKKKKRDLAIAMKEEANTICSQKKTTKLEVVVETPPNVPIQVRLMTLLAANAGWKNSLPKGGDMQWRISHGNLRATLMCTPDNPMARYVFAGGAPTNVLHTLSTPGSYSPFHFVNCDAPAPIPLIFLPDYCDNGDDVDDAIGVVDPIAAICDVYYFELLIKVLPKKGQVSIGFGGHGASLSAMYRLFRSNGFTHGGNARWERDGLKFGQADIVGVGMVVPPRMDNDGMAQTPQMFLTVNGKAGKHHFPVHGFYGGAVWPCIGMTVAGTMVEANFGTRNPNNKNGGTKPFVYDIKNHQFPLLT